MRGYGFEPLRYCSDCNYNDLAKINGWPTTPIREKGLTAPKGPRTIWERLDEDT